ncbi:MAG: glycogen debranching enzyme N-terminal domain-containing protein, partial [Candidatus Bathyarchaeota archaeon]|nr:glycogen debranching enzyme N-terminal domain-containing protein [Candidatus Bathyarchaeota archaeon]
LLLLSKLEEDIIIDGKRHALSVNKYPNTIYPDGNKYLVEFRLDPSPSYIYQIDGVTLEKTIVMPVGRNTSIISYKLDAPYSVELQVRPLVNCRGFHSRTRENSGLAFSQYPMPRGVRLESNAEAQSLYLKSSCGEYEPSKTWYRNMVYDLEAERGLVDQEDHFSPGFFKATLKDRDFLSVVASVDTSETSDEAVPGATASNKSALPSGDHLRDWLIHASDQFTVKLPDETSTIVAGYHWFGVWGRDAAIALPGLLLTTERFEEAKAVIRRYLKNTRNGLAPVYFDEDEKPHYASIDTSLWLIYSTYKYFKYTSDLPFIKEVYPKLREIIEWYRRGTDYSRIAEDFLLEAKSEKYSLTWMDARIDDTPATPRMGRCVEVNALWYNALRSVEELSRRLNEASEPYEELGSKVRSSFNKVFWYGEGGYLYDCVNDEEGDDSVRPNQIFSLSLPFPVLRRERWGSVFKNVERHLLTPYGLRSLSPSDPRYHGICSGSTRDRDLAYHNGTVWAWLAGPFISAYVKLGWSLSSVMIRHILQAFDQHLSKAGLGNLSEIFDGDMPHNPRGCIAQAWSVGELMRVISEDLGGIKEVSIK